MSSAVVCTAAVQRCLLVCSLVPMSLHEENLLLKRLKESISVGLMTPCPKLSRFYRKLCVRQVRAQLYVTTLLLHQFSGVLSRTTWVSQYRKGKTSLDLNEARSFGMQFRQLDHMQTICTLLQTHNHTNTSSLGTNLIHNFTAVTFFVKLAFFREKRLFP